jgi:putative ABC transport system permease protein
MIWKMAWRNIQRRKRKTIIIMATVCIGTIFALFGIAFLNGMKANYEKLVFGTVAGDINLNPISGALTYNNTLSQEIQKITGVQYISHRIMSNGMLSNYTKSCFVIIMGIEPDIEQKLADNFSTKTKPFILKKTGTIAINEKTARELGVKEGDMVSIVTNTRYGSINAYDFEVSTIYEPKVSNPAIQLWVLISLADAQQLLLYDNNQATQCKVFASVHEPKQLMPVLADIEKVCTKLNSRLTIQPWYDTDAKMFMIAPNIFTGLLWGFMMILFILIAIGISSIIITSIIDQIKEVGTLKTIGMFGWKIGMVYFVEIMIIVLAGTITGILLGGGLTFWLRSMAVRAPSDAMVFSFGGRYLWPFLGMTDLIAVFLLSITISVIAALLPIAKIVRMRIMEALSHN